MANYRGSEEEFARAYGGGSYGDGGAIASQINRGTDQIREDLSRGGEALRESNRNYFANIGNALEKGWDGYQAGRQHVRSEEEAERNKARFEREGQAEARTEEEHLARMEAAKQALESGNFDLSSKRTRAEVMGRVDQKTGKTYAEREVMLPFENAELAKLQTEESIAGGRQSRKLAQDNFDLTKKQDDRAVAAAQAQKANDELSAQVSVTILQTPKANLPAVEAQLMKQFPGQKAAVFKAIGEAKATRFAQQLAENSTPEGQEKIRIYQESRSALSNANELKGKLATFKANRTKGGINTPLGDVGTGMRNEVADNALDEIGTIIASDGTPAAQELAAKLASPWKLDSSVIADVEAYIAAKNNEAIRHASQGLTMFNGPEKDEYRDSLKHLVSSAQEEKNRPTKKGLDQTTAAGFLSGQGSQMQNETGITPANIVQPPPQPQQPPMAPPVQGGQASPMPMPVMAPQGNRSTLRDKYGRQR